MDIRTNEPIVQSGDGLASSFATSYAGVVAFMAVVTEGSFAKAGDRLGVGRSAVSRSVQKLEEQLGTRLFMRTTRSLSMTREGDLFYSRCHPGVEYISQALEGMRELREGPPRGQLRIASTVGFGRKVVAPLLAGFHAAFPQIELDLLLQDDAVDFAAERIDLCFRDGVLEDSQVVAKRLLPMQMLVCASAAYVRAHSVPSRVDDLADHRCINFRRASGRIQEWEFQVDTGMQRLLPPAQFTFNDLDLVLQAVLAGQGIAQLPAYLVGGLIRDKHLHSCLTDSAPPGRGHYLCYLSREHLPSRIRVFIDYMTDAIRKLDLRCDAPVDSQFTERAGYPRPSAASSSVPSDWCPQDNVPVPSADLVHEDTQP